MENKVSTVMFRRKSVNQINQETQSKWPNDIVSTMSKYLELKELIALSLVSRQFNSLLTHSHKNFLGFFQSKYCKNPGTPQYILSPERLTASHIRAGVSLVHSAIDKILDGDLHVDDQLNVAMYRYGSPDAMQLIKCLSKLGGRVELSFDIDHLIQLYQARIRSILENEYKPFFHQDDLSTCDNELLYARNLWSQKLEALISALPMSYRVPSFLKHIRKNYIQYFNFNDDIYIGPITFKAFDALGFLGTADPRHSKIWYLHTQTHKRFQESEEKLKQVDKLVDRLPSAKRQNLALKC